MSTPSSLTRRRFLQLAGGAVAALPSILQAKPAARPSLGISIFGSKALDQALRDCAEIGYENVEFHLGPQSSTDPAALSLPARRNIRHQLDSLGLTVSGMSLNTSSLGSEGLAHAKNLEAIKVGAQMGHDLYPGNPPPLQTGSGGLSADWDTDRNKLGDNLADWAATAAASGIGIAIKAHANNSVDTPEKVLWLMQRVHNPALTVDYDYSHFEGAGYSLEGSLTQLLPYTTFIQVKDARMENGRVRYLLPGEGDIDYAAYFRLLKKVGYTGPVVVEISAHVVRRPNFDFKTAAISSFKAVNAGRRALV